MRAADAVFARLYDRGDAFFSLDELAGVAGLDRAGVARALDELARAGHALDFSPAHGVRVIRPVRPHPYLIERDLGTRRVGRSVICFAEVDSTNDVAWDSARQADADGLVVLAESQHRGRGRHGRRWVSPPGANVLMSVLLTEAGGALLHEALTIAAGLAVAEAIEETSALRGELKWPNDVLVDGAKVAGVLVETRGARGGRGAVVGIGINAGAAPSPQEVPGPATCLADKLGHDVERIELIRAVLVHLDEWAHRVSLGRLDELHDRWLARCGMINQRVRIRCGDECLTGRALDISPLEGLILSCDDGRRVHLPADNSTVLD